MLFFGTTNYAAYEALELLDEVGIQVDAMCIKAFPFTSDVKQFLETHDRIFVIEQNRDAQMRTLLINEFDYNPKELESILHYDGTPITADYICKQIGVALNISEKQSQAI